MARGHRASHADTIVRREIAIHQQRLCISALEFRTCGVPVVSTRWGPPEDFVLSVRTANADASQARQRLHHHLRARFPTLQTLDG
jgi:hypothetical protein